MLYATRCVVPFFSGIHTLFVSQYVEMFVFAGALAGSAVLPHAAGGCLALGIASACVSIATYLRRAIQRHSPRGFAAGRKWVSPC